MKELNSKVKKVQIFKNCTPQNNKPLKLHYQESLDSDETPSIQSMSYECYRSCMNKVTRDYYDTRMQYKKKFDTKEKLFNIQKSYASNEYIFSKSSEKYMAKKRYYTKPIKAEMTKEINPIKTIRMADFIFPLDSSCLYSPNPFSIFQDLQTIKRAIKSEYDFEEG